MNNHSALKYSLTCEGKVRYLLWVQCLIIVQHYYDIIMSAMASQITSLMIVYSNVYWTRRSKKTSKLCVTGLCEGNSPVTGEFPTQRASNAENVSIWWRHHDQHEWCGSCMRGRCEVSFVIFMSSIILTVLGPISQMIFPSKLEVNRNLILVSSKWSLWNFAHGMTAVLSCHVQIL